MRILEVTPSVSRLGGGLFESVRHLAKAIHCSGQAEVSVLALADERTAEDVGQWAPLRVRAHKGFGRRRFGFSAGLLRDLMNTEVDVVHLHGLWRFTSVAVWLWAKRTGKPYLLSPHGMLEPWALNQRRLKKQAAFWLFQRRCLTGAACLRATSALETASIRQAGCHRPIVLVPNGVHRVSELVAKRSITAGQKRRALFLSRLHSKKGLLNLVEAWARVRPEGWQLRIAGPDEAGHLAQVKAKVRQCEIDDRIEFVGEQFGASKWRLYQEAELFVLPSFSENFGLVVGEALSCGVPVITTRATPWGELQERDCGWWVEVGVEPLAEALRQATSLPGQVLREMGKRGRQLIRERYDWGPIAGKMMEVYRRLKAEG